MVDFDVIVIGSGAGGLTAALALARAGKKVLVLEQHYLPGGWCHSFSLDGYKFSPGVHYIGQLQPGGRMRSIYEGLGVMDDIELEELNPDGFDHVLVSGERFDIPKGRERFEERLARRFPEERAGIKAFLAATERLGRELDVVGDVSSLVDALLVPFRAPTLARWGLRTAKTMIDHYAKHPRLRAILAAQSGDHGLPPSKCPAPVHAAVMSHYFQGGWYPKGGGGSIPRAYLRQLRLHGGEIRTRTGVSRILVEGRPGSARACGVVLSDGTELRAHDVISNADPGVTFGRLLAREHVPPGIAKRLRRATWSVSALSLFLATDADVNGAGLDSGNYWYYEHDDVDAIYTLGLTASGLEQATPPGFFVTVTTLKDPSKQAAHPGRHTIEAFSFVGWEPFRRWAHTRYGERPEDYARMKEDLTRRMLRAVSRVVPGVEDHVLLAELGTPLTNVHYVAATEGNLYGTAKTRSQVGPGAFPIRSGLRGLTLCGASTLSHGVMGATISGLAAARAVLRVPTAELLRARPAPAEAHA